MHIENGIVKHGKMVLVRWFRKARYGVVYCKMV